MDEIKVNDGGGLLDNLGLIRSLGVDLNNLVKQTMSGNYVAFCGIVYSMFKKIENLETGVKNDTDSLNRRVKELQRLIDDINGAKGDKDV